MSEDAGLPVFHALTMPKWGLAMVEGKVGKWLVDQGAEIAAATEVVEIETDKILSALEAPLAGVLCRKVARDGDLVPVGGLIGVLASQSTSDSEVDSFVSDFVARFVPAPTGAAASSAGPLTAAVKSFTLRYLEQGKGAPEAVLIHGFGGDLNTWLFNHEDLASTRCVIALDLPGHGGSSKHPGSGTLREFSRLLGDFLDARDLTAVHLAGHSMGGAVALDFGLTHPERVLSLTLIASAGLGVEIDGQYIEGFISAARRKDLAPYVEKLFGDPKLITRQLIEDILKYKRLDGVEAALRAIASQFFPGGRQATVLRDQLTRLTMPVLVIWGAEDRILPSFHSQGLPGNVRTDVLAGCGHMVHMEAAQKVNQLIRHFWDNSGEKKA
jgi:pyruvate dehydrogenase E2 component (dihydrolipoamide acetyltransferase)